MNIKTSLTSYSINILQVFNMQKCQVKRLNFISAIEINNAHTYIFILYIYIYIYMYMY